MNPFARRPPFAPDEPLAEPSTPTPMLPPAPDEPCVACNGTGRVYTAFALDGQPCAVCLGTGHVCTTTPTEQAHDLPATQPTGYEPPDPVGDARASGLATAKRRAIFDIETGRDNGTGHVLDPKPTDTHPVVSPNAKVPSEIAGPLAMLALRRLEKGLHDYDPKVSFEAARVAVTVAGRVAEIPNAPGSDVADPVARRAALVAALGTPAVIEIVLAVARLEGPLRTAMEDDGWTKGEPIP